MEHGTVKMVQLKEGKQVYTRTVGEGLPILLLHGGPGANHVCFEIFEKYLDLKKYSLIYYDQLGSTNSDKIEANDTRFLSLPRYTDEVEQVRAALGLDKFILLGHSWGGMLCVEYALKYQNDGHLLGMVISNMTYSGRINLEYLGRVRKENLTDEEYRYMLDTEAKGNESEARYQDLVEKLSKLCLCRLDPWPDFLYLPNVPAKEVYNYFEGDNEFVLTGDMLYWDRTEDIEKIKTRTLCIGAKYDSISPEVIQKMGDILPNGYTYICPEGAHLCFWDDSGHYFGALNEFLNEFN